MALEKFVDGDLSLRSLRQVTEQLALRAKHITENRENARANHELVDKPEDFNPEMLWVEGQMFPGYRIASGYTLSDIEKETPSQAAYWCDDCTGWVKGSPREEPYNNITFLAGSQGVKYNCRICDREVASLTLAQS